MITTRYPSRMGQSGTFEVDARMIPSMEELPLYAQQSDFAEVGKGFVDTAVEWGLSRAHRVLDLGCGVGRFAAAFASFAGPEGRYDGLDLSRESIKTCRRYIKPHREGFAFHVADVHNSHYRRFAGRPAADYRFPFRDRTFDFVFSNSLFTHLALHDAEHYLHEIGRVLKPGSRALNTMFLLNDESKRALARRKVDLLPHETDGGLTRIKQLDRPEAMIALDEDYLRRAYDEAGMDIVDPVRYGAWSGRESTGSGFGRKDIIVSVRR